MSSTMVGAELDAVALIFLFVMCLVYVCNSPAPEARATSPHVNLSSSNTSLSSASCKLAPILPPTARLNHQYLVMSLDQFYFANHNEPSKLDYILCKQDCIIVDISIDFFSLSDSVMSYNLKIY
ncbi:unnamed protein product [Musa textilis]